MIKGYNLGIGILLFTITLISNAQNYQATYVLKLDQQRKNSYLEQLKKNKPDNLNSVNFIRNLEQEQPVKATLLFNQDESIYQVKKYLNRDDLNFSGFLKSLAGGSSIYFNTIKNQFRQKIIKGEKNYVFNKEINWQISKKKKTIYGHTCRMAFGKNNPSVQAWFSKSLSFPFGPMYYFGLPGLIFEVDYMYFELKLIKLTKTTKNINIPQNIEIISQIDFYDKYNIKNPFIEK